MIRVSEEKDIEKLLKDSCFTNEIHRKQLWGRLQREPDLSEELSENVLSEDELSENVLSEDELSEDELAMAAGGVTLPEIPSSSKQQL